MNKEKELFDFINSNKFKNNNIRVLFSDGSNKKNYIIRYRSGLAFSVIKYNKPLDYHFGINEYNYSIDDIIKLIKTETLSYWRKKRIDELDR